MLSTGADVKANFSASAPYLNGILPCKISIRGAATLANP